MKQRPQDTAVDGRPLFVLIEHDALAMLPAVGPAAFAVYAVLVRHASAETGRAFPAHSTLAKATGLSQRTVIRSLDALEGAGLVSIDARFSDGRQVSNIYTVRPAPARGDKNDTPGVHFCQGGGDKNDRGGVTKTTYRTRTTELEPREQEQTPPTPAPQAATAERQLASPTVEVTGEGSAPRQQPTGQRDSRPLQATNGDTPGAEAKRGTNRWRPVADAVAAAVRFQAQGRGKLPPWLGNTVRAFGAASQDDPGAALALVARWAESRGLRDLVTDQRYFAFRRVPENAHAWLAAHRPAPRIGEAVAAGAEDARLARLGAPSNWREFVYTHDGTRRHPSLVLPSLGLEPYARPDTWPAWYRAVEGVAA